MQVLARDKYRCKYCGAKLKDGTILEIDHIKPVSRGGNNSTKNLQVLCLPCNRKKGNKWE